MRFNRQVFASKALADQQMDDETREAERHDRRLAEMARRRRAAWIAEEDEAIVAAGDELRQVLKEAVSLWPNRPAKSPGLILRPLSKTANAEQPMKPPTEQDACPQYGQAEPPTDGAYQPKA